jgi:hypothetical protein
MIGPSARSLGVRPSFDVTVQAGFVHPNAGGLSVEPDRPEYLHVFRRPPALGGLGKDPVWYITIAWLGVDLQFREDSATHGVIEPARTMLFVDFEKALEHTKAHWKRLP